MSLSVVQRWCMRWPRIGRAWRMALVVSGAALLWTSMVAVAAAQAPTGTPLDNPVAMGAWLYAGNCVRCHGEYADARVGEDLKAKELKARVSGEDPRGCNVAWSKSRGGTLSVKEIRALVDYMVAWEQEGDALVLPPLPPQPTKTPTPSPKAAARDATPAATPTPTPLPLDPAIQAAIDGDPIAHGAWLYARTCVVCHSDYRTARMARNLTPDEVERTIKDGKTGTNMVGFGPRNGNLLKAREIDAVVQYITAWEALGDQPDLPAPIAEVLALAVATNPTPTPTIAAGTVPPAVPSPAAIAATKGVDDDSSPLSELMLLPWLALGITAVMAGGVVIWEMRGE